MSEHTKRLYLIDGSSYIYRAYYAIRHLSNGRKKTKDVSETSPGTLFICRLTYQLPLLQPTTQNATHQHIADPAAP